MNYITILFKKIKGFLVAAMLSDDSSGVIIINFTMADILTEAF
jgi:hypothetical protein